MNYEITFIGDSTINNVHHIGISYDGNYYSVIFGRYVNGGFCCIPSLNIGCELAAFDDVFWNTESIYRALKKKRLAEICALAIAEFSKV